MKGLIYEKDKEGNYGGLSIGRVFSWVLLVASLYWWLWLEKETPVSLSYSFSIALTYVFGNKVVKHALLSKDKKQGKPESEGIE